MCVFSRDCHGPLHLSASWGLESVVQTLLEYGAEINAQVWGFEAMFASLVQLNLTLCAHQNKDYFPAVSKQQQQQQQQQKKNPAFSVLVVSEIRLPYN